MVCFNYIIEKNVGPQKRNRHAEGKEDHQLSHIIPISGVPATNPNQNCVETN